MAAQHKFHSEELSIVKKIVLSKELLRKINYSEEMAAPEKQLLCQSSYFKEAWRSSFYKKLKKKSWPEKAWKSRYITLI